MTEQSTYPRIILPEGVGTRIPEIEDNEWFSPEVELENSDRYTLNFYTQLRLGQSLDILIKRGGEPWLAELNIILVPQVTLKAAQECIQALGQKGFFKFLKPDEASRQHVSGQGASISSSPDERKAITDQPTYPRIIFPEGSGEDDYDGYIEDNEWFSPEVELENSDRYTLNFITPLRLKQDLDIHIKRGGEPWLAELNVILVPEVTLKAAKECVHALWQQGFFKFLKSDDEMLLARQQTRGLSQ